MKKLLVIDPALATASLVAKTLAPRGVAVRSAGSVAEAEALAATEPPDALWVFAEPTSDTGRQLLASTTLIDVPTFRVSADVSDVSAARAFRTGLVDVFALPFDPERHLSSALATFAALGARKGAQGTEGLNRFLQHVRRLQRTGLLQTAPGTAEEGRAQFVRGQLQSASRSGEAGEIALLSMVGARGPWRFIETAHEPQRARPAKTSARIPLLFVDDDPAMTRLFSVLFQKHGYDVTTAPDGLAAFELAVERRFELVVADLNMPRLDGWGLLRKLRFDFRTLELPVAFLSAHDDYREALRAKDAGAQAYFAKGTRLEPLVKQVGALLEPRQRFTGSVASADGEPQPLYAVGAQWACRYLGTTKRTGCLQAQDGWAQYAVYFREGALVHAAARSGAHEAQGAKAFNAFLGSVGATGRFVPDATSPLATLEGDVERAIEQAWTVLNRNAAAAEEAILVGQRPFTVDPELYALYAQLGPKQWLEAARLLCEERLSPGEVIARSHESPLEVEQLMRDLVRRGVIFATAP